MKRFFGLLQNELIKIWKQTGYRVMLFVIIGISLLTPIFGLLTTTDFGETAQDEYEMYLEWASLEEDGIWGQYYQATADAILFFIDNGIADGWKYSQFEMQYKNHYLRAVAAQLFESGELTLEELEDSPFDMYFSYYGNSAGPGDTVMPDDTVKPDSEVVDPESKYDIPTYAEAKAELDALSDEILSYTERDYALMMIEIQTENTKAAEENAEQLKQLYEADPKNSALEYELKVAEEELRGAKIALESCQALYDNSAAPDDWAYSMHNLLTQCFYHTASCVPMPQAIYEGEDYDSYLSQCERAYDYYNEAASVYLHSIKTNNCLSPISDNSMLSSLLGVTSFGTSTKAQLRSALVSSINLVTIFMVVLAAGIISSEFTSGTIRLLVIRPCTRRQIMLSKLAAVGAVYVGIVILLSILITAETVILFGIGDLFAPDSVYISDRVVDLPFFVITLERIIIASLAALAYTAIAVILASLTRKNGLAITMSMLVYAFGSVVTTVALLMAEVFPNVFGWVVYTPLVYMSLASIVPPAHELMSGTGGMFGLSGVELWIGALYHIVLIVGMSYLAVIAFRKKQIKN